MISQILTSMIKLTADTASLKSNHRSKMSQRGSPKHNQPFSKLSQRGSPHNNHYSKMSRGSPQNKNSSRMSLRTTSSLMNETHFSQWHRASLVSPLSGRHSAFAKVSLNQKNQQMFSQMLGGLTGANPDEAGGAGGTTSRRERRLKNK